MRHWFIGDGVVVRYGDDGNARVRVRPEIGEPRSFRVSLLDEAGKELTVKQRIDLSGALRLGEEWLP